MSPLVKCLSLVSLSLSFVGLAAESRADGLPTPLLSSDNPYSSLVFVRGASLTAATVRTETAGTVTVKLSDLAWPNALSSLSFALSNSTSQLFTTSGAGLWSWQISGPTTLFASVYATADVSKNAGLYGFDMSFSPTSPVPLPAAAWLLVSGLMGLAGVRRKHTAVTQAVVH